MNETITITGNIATDPEYKSTAGGVPLTKFRVASSQRRYDRQSGTWSDGETNWYSVSLFRSLADHAYASLRKGDRVLLTGRLHVRAWDNGAKQGTTVEIEAEAIGHDLLWGTSRFEKRRSSAVLERAESEAANRAPDEWAAPGVDGDAGQEWPVVTVPTGVEESRPLELAGVEAPF